MASLRFKEALCVVYSALLFASGILLLAFSVVLCYKVFYHFSFIPSNTLGPLIFLFILGIVHVALTWLGVKGPTREHNFHIIMFIVFTIILLICELTVGVWSMVLWDEASVLSSELQTKSFLKMKEICTENNWIKVQHRFRCCGMHGVSDYSRDECKKSCIDHVILNATVEDYYEGGCQIPFIKYLKGILVKGALIGFVSGAFQALGIFLFYTFFQSLRLERRERAARLSARQSAQSQPTPDTPLVYPTQQPVDYAPPPSAHGRTSSPPASPTTVVPPPATSAP